MKLIKYQFDVLIVGGGGSGLRAALELGKQNINVAVISKVFPTRSHTVSAQGGITCAIASADPNDDWRWHMYDTIKGSDYLGDQEAIEYMCYEGPKSVFEMEHEGLPFSRNEDGRIYQRPFGGQSKNYGKGGQAARTCAAADRTGHALLHTLYQANLKYNVNFFDEWFLVDLIKTSDNKISGALALDITSGEYAVFEAKALVLATGGGGRVYQTTSNALINTGDGIGLALRANFPVQDMEMWQFHPTGIAGFGCLISEATRGEGGYLTNAEGERFMERYAPTAKDLAGRDVVARSIMIEILEGRGAGENKDYINLNLNHLDDEVFEKKLPGITELAMNFANVDPRKAPIPIIPTCHYMMGGIPTNIYGQVLYTNDENLYQYSNNLYAVGETACISVHGANRMGGNSLLDLIVFGKASGIKITKLIKKDEIEQTPIQQSDYEHLLEEAQSIDNNTGRAYSEIKKEVQSIMQDCFGVFRKEDKMRSGLNKIEILTQESKEASIKDKSKIFNTSRIEALELKNLCQVALSTCHSAIARTESRGAHSRYDYDKRDDENWLCHTLYYKDSTEIIKKEINFAPKQVPKFEPKERLY